MAASLSSSKNSDFFFVNKDGTIGATSGYFGARVLSTSDANIKIVTAYVKNTGGAGTSDISFRGATGGTLGDESFTGDGATTMFFIWAAIVAKGPLGSPIITTGTSSPTSSDKLEVDLSNIWTPGSARITVDLDWWMFPIDGELQILYTSNPGLANSLNCFKTGTDLIDFFVYDDGAVSQADAYDQVVSHQWGDHFLIRQKHVQGNQITSILRNGSDQAQTASTGAGTNNWTGVGTQLDFHQGVASRESNLKIYGIEIG